MAKLGFSLYPEHEDLDSLKTYVDQFLAYPCERVFLSLLQLDPEDQAMFAHYRAIIGYCAEKGLSVFADVSPSLITKMGWQEDLVTQAKAFGLAGLRLDESYPDEQLVALTQNAEGLNIELNMSTEPKLLERLVAQGANLENVTACHNFYPREFTGLGTAYFLDISQQFSDYDLERAAFITAHSADTGPWPVSEGLCTLEVHRHLPLRAQYKWLAATGLVEHIIIANQKVSSEELATLATAELLTFDMELNEGISEIERQIITENHVYRGDVSDYVIRSTGHRAKYSQATINPYHAGEKVSRGDILIDNSLYGRYCGELQIALCDFQASEKTNTVGRICPEDLPLLDLIKPWQDFRFEVVTKEGGHVT
ncbi:DUF871 domain-containing protein [Streptococcus merionis]|uniref:DUF871 domain-containing protein n=1 Tax=Streptococcus merionis TaxID=400065 RepID=UPI0026F1AA2B|nr:MupG family TIM beta-alpha barrel fold protein [Streptococcus merionis]